MNARLRPLGLDECWRLLETEDVGRLAIVQGRVPSIFPMNYLVDGRTILFRTDPGSKLLHGRGQAASFEIDGTSRTERIGWSVVATGRLDEDRRLGPAELAAHDLGRLLPWAGGEKGHWLRLDPGIVTGREIISVEQAAREQRVAEATAVVRAAVHEVAPELDLDQIDPAAMLTDALDLDPAGFVALMAAVEDRTGVGIAAADQPLVATLDGLVEHLAEHG